MNSRIPSIRARFFRVLMTVGGTATLFTALGITIASYWIMRHAQFIDFKHTARMVAVIPHLLDIRPNADINHYLKRFNYPGLTMICVYDAYNTLIAYGEILDSQKSCPAMMIEPGVKSGITSITIAEPVQIARHYHGMVYVEGQLAYLHEWMMGCAALLVALFSICMSACWAGAVWSSRRMASAMHGLVRQVECLKEKNAEFCPLPVYATVQETLELSRSITSLRAMLDATMLPKESLENLKRWYWEVLSGLLTTLKQRMQAESPLLEGLGDYALLVESERGDVMPEIVSFNLARLLDASLEQARHSYTVDTQLHVTASLHSHTPQQWNGYPQMLQALMRHLLIIGFKRTRTGFVCLRLEAISAARLNIAYEDSGPPIQHWQLQHWLAPSREDTPAVGMTDDISWLLISRLARRLGGSITGKNNANGGLMLEISLPMLMDMDDAQPKGQLPYADHSEEPKLALVVEKDPYLRKKLIELADAAGLRCFIVTTHAQALEWALVLPFAVIILNGDLEDMNDDIIRRLGHLREESTMDAIPFWMMASMPSSAEAERWRSYGINTILARPLHAEMLIMQAGRLPAASSSFYRKHDPRQRRELPPSILDAMGELDHMLGLQIAEIMDLLKHLVQGRILPEMMDKAHAVKSASLNLGYFRLAGLMSEIEHTIASHRMITISANWQIIIDMLRESGFTLAKTLPSVPSLPHNAAGH